jgi:hypothetical protein
MDRICSGGMKDYVLANYKDSGRPTLLRITTFDGNMNPDMSKVDLTPNPEVNDRIVSYVSIIIMTCLKRLVISSCLIIVIITTIFLLLLVQQSGRGLRG